MQFLQPALLWGTLAIAIPIALHFWHQKKGTVMAWAAMRFLFEKNQQSQRGLRLDQILLLVLRCLLLLVLAFLLSEPILKMVGQTGFTKKIHLVQPDAFLVNNYRFELEEARKNGETVFWLTPSPQVADELTPPAGATPWNTVMVQNAINQVAREGEALHLYLKNERTLHPLPFIQTPADFHLHAMVDTLGKAPRTYRQVSNQQKLYIDAADQLRVGDAAAGVPFAAQPVGEGPLSVRIDLNNPLERKTAEAALRAFAEVYRMELTLEERDSSSEVVITDRVPAAPQPAVWYLITDQAGSSAYPNVAYFPEKLLPQASPLVANGQLPEWMGRQLVDHWGIRGSSAASLSTLELKTLFHPTALPAGNPAAATQQIIFVLLLVLIIFERIIALTRNA
jgi:hypothetical protein